MEPGTRPAFSLPSDNQIRLALVTLLGLGFAIYLGMRAGQGDVKFVSGLFLAGVLAVVVMSLGARSWLLLPFGMTLNVPVPITFGRDFSCRELACMALILHTVVRVALRRQKLEILRKENLWPMLYAGWVFMVFIANPIGLMSLGAETVGARFYFQIFLGFCSFLIVANSSPTEREFKWFFMLTLAAACINVLYGVWFWRSGEAMIGVQVDLFSADEDFYTWHQALTFPALFLVMMTFARYRLQEIASWRNAHLWGVILLVLGVISFSGKRAGVGSLLLIPVFAAFLRRRAGVGLSLVLGVALVVGLLTVSHGRWLNLPISTQRALSWLPGDWDVRVRDLGTKDEFRKAMREAALEEIERHPWLGPGFAINIKDYWGDRTTSASKITAVTAGHSWHTLWLGIAADFGIPAALIWGLLWIHFTRLSFVLAPKFPDQSWAGTMVSYIFLYLCWQWSNSYTSGHSAQPAFDGWWIYALLIPLKQMLETGKKGEGWRTGYGGQSAEGGSASS